MLSMVEVGAEFELMSVTGLKNVTAMTKPQVIFFVTIAFHCEERNDEAITDSFLRWLE